MEDAALQLQYELAFQWTGENLKSNVRTYVKYFQGKVRTSTLYLVVPYFLFISKFYV